MDGVFFLSILDEIWKFVKEIVVLVLKEWNDKNGIVDVNVCLCLGKDVIKEIVFNVVVEKVLLKLIYGFVLSCE